MEKKYNKKNIGVIILAAGRGTRLGLKKPKPLAIIHKQETAIGMLIDNIRNAGLNNITVVVGYRHEEIEKHLFKKPGVRFSLQRVLSGTLTATLCGVEKFENFIEDIIIFPADNGALLKSGTVEDLIKTHVENNSMVTLLLTADYNAKTHKIYIKTVGRQVTGIQLTSKSNVIEGGRLYNTGILCVKKKYLQQNHNKIKALPNGEYTVTRIIEVALSNKDAVYYHTANEREIATINTQADLKKVRKQAYTTHDTLYS